MSCPFKGELEFKPLGLADLGKLRVYAYKDENVWWRLRKVCVTVCDNNDEIIYCDRFFTTWFPRLKRRLIARRVRRLLYIMKGE